MLNRVIRVVVALVVLLAVALAAWTVWSRHSTAPTTRDGRIRADIVKVAPDVGGIVTEVTVQDNQEVKAGDVLFVLDSQRYQQDLAQAEADLMAAQAAAEAAKAGIAAADASVRSSASVHAMQQERADRRAKLSEWLAAETISDARKTAQAAGDEVTRARADLEAARSNVSQAQAAVVQAQAKVERARLNVERAAVRASTDGRITNLTVKAGDYIGAGQPIMALLVNDSLWVYGYFEETKIPAIEVGAPAEITLMAGGLKLRGTVESISPGIADSAANTSGNLLANVTPTFSWVRLAQRIPVRIRIEQSSVPADANVAAGMTASVRVLPSETAGR